MNKNESGFRFKLNRDRVGYYNTARDEIVVERSESLIRWNLPTPTTLRQHGPLLQLENVSFKYPSSQTPILQNVTLSIEPGARLAFVGEQILLKRLKNWQATDSDIMFPF